MQATYSAATGALSCACNATADLNCLLSDDFRQSRLPAALPDQQFPSNIQLGAQAATFYGVTPALATLQVQSPVLGQLALASAGKCLATGSREACNALANACVLQMYDSSSVACKLYQGVVNSRNPGEVVVAYHSEELRGSGIAWTDTLPWLYYKGASAADWQGRGDVGLKMSFYSQRGGSALTSGAPAAPPFSRPIASSLRLSLARAATRGSAGSALPRLYCGTKQSLPLTPPRRDLSRAVMSPSADLTYILSVYLINGTWVGFRPLTNQFQLCGTVAGGVGNQWRRFGTRTHGRRSPSFAFVPA